MSMKTMYWVSQIFSWNYIDIAGKTYGRIDWFENMRDMGYWWQTGHETGIAFSVEQAKRGVEEAVMRRRMELEARYLASMVGPVDPDVSNAQVPMDRPSASLCRDEMVDVRAQLHF